MAEVRIRVAISIFPRHGANRYLVAKIDLQKVDLAKVAELLGIGDEYEFFSGEWEIETEEIVSYFEEAYGVRFRMDNFSYFVDAYQQGTPPIKVTRSNFRSVLT